MSQGWNGIRTVEKTRTIGFLICMIPILAVVALLLFLSLVLCAPMMAYARIQGRHLKNPWRRIR